jgi:hypothetical protein
LMMFTGRVEQDLGKKKKKKGKITGYLKGKKPKRPLNCSFTALLNFVLNIQCKQKLIDCNK